MATRLDCGDTVEFSPTPYTGDVVYCRSCKTYRTVVEGGINDEKHENESDDINVTISCLNCTFKRNLTSEPEARIQANTHALRRHHEIQLHSAYGDEIIRSSIETKT